MSTTLNPVPLYPIKDQQVALSFVLSQPGANFVRVWCVAAPPDSELDKELQKKNAANLAGDTFIRVEVYSGDASLDAAQAAKQPWVKTFDKGGKYSFVAQEYTRGTGFRGGYQGDPRGIRSESKLGGETTLTLHVGQRYEAKVGVSPDTATVVFYMWDDVCRATDLKNYGVATPTVINDRPTAKAKIAMRSVIENDVVAPLAGKTTDQIIGDPTAVLQDIFDNFSAHIARPAPHINADTVNGPPNEYRSPVAPKDLPTQINALLRYWRRHYFNDSGGGIGSAAGTGSYHNGADFTDAPLYNSVSTLEEAYAALADLWRSLSAHMVNITVHPLADTPESGLSPLPYLLVVHREFIKVLAALNVTPPVAQSTGMAKLISRTGGKEV